MATTETVAPEQPAERVECDNCGIKVRLRKDGTYPPHGWTRAGKRFDCEKSGKPYAFHMGSFHYSHTQKLWVGQCRCGETWTGPEHTDVDTAWAKHAGAQPMAATKAAEAGAR